MSNSKKTAKIINPPFCLPSVTKHHYQRAYLYYINQTTPIVSEKLKALTSSCVNLFGEYPLKDKNQDEARGLWWKIEKAFNCVYKEAREYEGISSWIGILREHNEILNQICEREEKMNEEASKFVESMTKEGLDELREIFSNRWTKPKDKITTQDLQSAYMLYKWQHRFHNDKDFAELIRSKFSYADVLVQFQNDFDFLLAEFCFEKRWLIWAVFKAIWSGTGVLQTEDSIHENIPKEIIIEIRNRLNIKSQNEFAMRLVPKPNGEYVQNDFGFGKAGIPLSNAFNFTEQYWIFGSFDSYKEKAIESYRCHLDEYFNIIKESFEKFGYKQSRRRYDYTRVEWLVQWNIGLWSKDQILQHLANKTDKFLTLDSIDKAFRKFKEYDLPVRKSGGNN